MITGMVPAERHGARNGAGNGGTPDDGVGAMSDLALQLHARALLFSMEDGHAGFVPDAFVAGFGEQTQGATAELCTAGVWQRASNGYVIASAEALRMAREVQRAAAESSD